jgi:hypothetical protein
MKAHWLAVVPAVAMALASAPAYAQSIISARSGLVHYVEGDVYLADQKVEPKFGNFPDVKEKSVLRSEEGRAEVLLNPGVCLRLGERSSFRMVTSRLVDTRIELLSGSAVVEADEVTKDANVTVVVKDATVTLRKTGVYRFDMAPARLRVYGGDASITLGDKTIAVGSGKTLTFEGESAGVLNKFDKEDTDPLDRWSRRRGQAIAMANVSAAKSLRDSGQSLYASTWRWNPYFGMFTFIPMSGMYAGAYGYEYWSPGSVNRIYYQQPVQTYAGGSGYGASNSFGYNTASHTSGGFSGAAISMGSSSSGAAVSNSGSTSSAAAGSSSIGRGAGGGGGGGRSH